MTEVPELRCERCGGTGWSHRLARDRQGIRRWQNRCEGCGHLSEFLPTPEEIQYECAKIRCEQGLIEVDEEHEKFWRQRAEELCPDTDSQALDAW